MNTINEKLSFLSKLDLSKYPEKEIKGVFSNLGKVAAIKTTLHAGKVILRARPNYNGEVFTKISQISYKPSEFNKTFQRASTPKNTMFYGSFVSELKKDGELDMTRVIGLYESLPFMRDPNSSGEQKITYSKWIVTKDIELISLIHHREFKRENSYAEQQRLDFEKFLSTLPIDVAENSKLVAEYISKEFAKDVTPNDYDYMISALYTEMAIEMNLAHGVMYPSVRTGGDGFNVAIHPYFVHNHMVPAYVGECTIYKNKENTFVDNDTGTILWDGISDFELKPVIPELHLGREESLKKI